MTEFHDEIDPFEYDDNGDAILSGWTDEEIAAYDAYLSECDRYDDLADYPGPVDIGNPPF